MTIGDQIWADASSRAEIQVGSAMIRMDQNTGFSFLNLDDRTVQIQLTDGTLDLRVHRLRTGEVFEVAAVAGDMKNPAVSKARKLNPTRIASPIVSGFPGRRPTSGERYRFSRPDARARIATHCALSHFRKAQL